MRPTPCRCLGFCTVAAAGTAAPACAAREATGAPTRQAAATGRRRSGLGRATPGSRACRGAGCGAGQGRARAAVAKSGAAGAPFPGATPNRRAAPPSALPGAPACRPAERPPVSCPGAWATATAPAPGTRVEGEGRSPRPRPHVAFLPSCPPPSGCHVPATAQPAGSQPPGHGTSQQRGRRLRHRPSDRRADGPVRSLTPLSSPHQIRAATTSGGCARPWGSAANKGSAPRLSGTLSEWGNVAQTGRSVTNKVTADGGSRCRGARKGDSDGHVCPPSRPRGPHGLLSAGQAPRGLAVPDPSLPPRLPLPLPLRLRLCLCLSLCLLLLQMPVLQSTRHAPARPRAPRMPPASGTVSPCTPQPRVSPEPCAGTFCPEHLGASGGAPRWC